MSIEAVLTGEQRWHIEAGDVLDVLSAMPAECVQTCVTSPPYWGLRDYGTAAWIGGDPSCDHQQGRQTGRTNSDKQASNAAANIATWSRCGRCGAARADSQLGLEATPDEYVHKMVEVFRAVRRVLRRDGTLWLNLGDSYAGSWGNYGSRAGTQRSRISEKWHRPAYENADNGYRDRPPTCNPPGLKAKDLCMIPARVALALQADGWYLRSVIIWSKPNPMPESVTDRPTNSHEYLYLLAPSENYYYDQEAIREHGPGSHPLGSLRSEIPGRNDNDRHLFETPKAGRNRRSVWTVASQPFAEAHFATFPPALIEPCVLAGTSERGCCPECGAPCERVVERIANYGKRQDRGQPEWKDAQVDSSEWRPPTVTDKGWQPTCKHTGLDPVPCVVFDPFMGAGTTALVALRHNRRALGAELNPTYIEIARKRIEGDAQAQQQHMDMEATT